MDRLALVIAFPKGSRFEETLKKVALNCVNSLSCDILDHLNETQLRSKIGISRDDGFIALYGDGISSEKVPSLEEMLRRAVPLLAGIESTYVGPEAAHV